MSGVVGMRFTRLVALEELPVTVAPKGYKQRKVRVRCDCGTEKLVEKGSLTGGLTKSCGCLHRESARINGAKQVNGNGNTLKLAGKRFGMLEVLGYAYTKKNSTYWNTRCDCGVESIKKGAMLKFGNTKSCGCRIIAASIANGKRNKGRIIQSKRDKTAEKWIGKKYNKLEIVDIISRPVGGPLAVCKCDCGGEKTAAVSDIARGFVMTCGCSRAGISAPEEGLLDFVRTIDPEAMHDVSLGNRQRYDVISEKYKMCFEMNGIYWHCGKFKTRSYHSQKRRTAEDLGYQMISVWQDDWDAKRDIIKGIIRRRMGAAELKSIGARKCKADAILQTAANMFHDKHHLQGGGQIGGKSYALTYGAEVIAVATFKGNTLTRYTVADGITIPGGLRKLISAAGLTKVVTYADRDYFAGELYMASGFTHTGTSLRMTYYQNMTRYPRERFMKHKLPGLGIDVLPGDTEASALERVRAFPCFNSGVDRFELIAA